MHIYKAIFKFLIELKRLCYKNTTSYNTASCFLTMKQFCKCKDEETNDIRHNYNQMEYIFNKMQYIYCEMYDMFYNGIK